jgi:TPR repeat protein
MGIPVYFGTKLYGQIDNADGTSDATQFFHIYYVPLVPTGGYKLTNGHAEPCSLNLLSIASAYLKVWGAFFVLGFGIWSYDAIMHNESMATAAVPPLLTILFMFLLFASWFWLGRRASHYARSSSRTIAISLVFVIPTLIVGARFMQRFGDRAYRSTIGSPSYDPQRSAAQLLGGLAAISSQNQARADLTAQQKRCMDGNAATCVNLGVRYLKGEGVATDGKLAITLFERACVAKDAQGCTNAGIVANNAQGGFARDTARAVAAYQKGCELNASDSCNNLGNLIEKGDAGPADPVAAAVLYGKACDQRNGIACGNLSRFYEKGIAVQRSASRAQAFRKLACAYGQTSSCGKRIARR